MMKKNIFTIIASIWLMHGAYAQDSVSVKMNQIDEYRESILAHKHEFLSVGFPLKWYADGDSIFYYFKDNCLVLIEHSSDEIIDGDTNVVRAIAYKRVFFNQNRLCLEEEFTKSYEEHQRVAEDRSRFIIEVYNYMNEKRNYYDIINDHELSFVSRQLEAPEAMADSLFNTTEWYFFDISKYKYSRGINAFRSILEEIEENGFVLPEGVIMPYSD